VAYTLCRKSLHMSALMVKELELIERFQDLNFVSELTPSHVKLRMLKMTSNFGRNQEWSERRFGTRG
jgi:hypothetical protein